MLGVASQSRSLLYLLGQMAPWTDGNRPGPVVLEPRQVPSPESLTSLPLSEELHHSSQIPTAQVQWM